MENLYNTILQEQAYFKTRRHEKQILLNGFKRLACINKAFYAQVPSEVDEKCIYYPARYYYF